jgi:UDP-GlcNAc:undecaprenyl-phosphate GlcNAc-1-phosphate transferase
MKTFRLPTLRTLYRLLTATGVLGVLLLPQTYHFTDAHPALYTLYLLMLAFLLSYLLTAACIWLGPRLGFVDHPDGGRKQHKEPTPLTGGVAIVTAFVAVLLINFHFSTEMKAILTGSLLIFLVGLIDDRWGLSARIRLLVQVIASLIVIFYGIRISFVPEYLGGVVTETIITIIWLLGITNAMNFIDGMDGIAGGTSITQAIFFALIAYATQQMYMMYLAIALAGSCLGFLPYNFRTNRPARIFLGDNGSTFLGFLLACIALLGEWGASIIDAIVPVLIMSVLIFDQSLTTFLRIYRGHVRSFADWINFTGRDHFHHQLGAIFASKVLAFVVYHSVNVCFGLAALAILFSNTAVALIVLLHTVLAFIIMGMILVFGNNRESSTGTQRTSDIKMP